LGVEGAGWRVRSVDRRRAVRAWRGQGVWDSIKSQRCAGGAVATRESPRWSANAAHPVSARYFSLATGRSCLTFQPQA
jgi:hypothetical protein